MVRKKQNEIWQFFNNDDESGFARCKTCQHKLRNNRVSNLKMHLLKLHNINVVCSNNESSAETSSLCSSSREPTVAKKKVTNNRRKNSIVWKFFDNNEDEGFAICKTCNNKFKNGRTSNLKTHLLRVHKINILCKNEMPSPETKHLASVGGAGAGAYSSKVMMSSSKKCQLRSKNKKKHSAVWQFFDNDMDEGMATCKTCKKKLKNNRISNIKAHLMRLHKINIVLCKKESASGELKPTYAIRSMAKLIRSNEKKKLKIEMSKNLLLRSYIGLITEESIPFNVLQSTNMRNIFQPICDGLNRVAGDNETKIYLNLLNCKETLQIIANNVREDIAMNIKNKLLSLKIDSGATGLPGQNISVISAQFINGDGEIKSYILGMFELKANGTTTTTMSKVLAIEVLKILKQYKIISKQLVSLTLDNDANKLQTSTILSFLYKEEEQDAVVIKKENESDCIANEYLRNYEFIDDNNIMPDMAVAVSIQNCGCAAHTAQLCIVDAITSPSTITKYLLTCRNLIKYINNIPNRFQDIFEMQQLQMPQLDCLESWGSTYAMLEQLKSAEDILKDNIETLKNLKQDEENFVIDDTFWEFIASYLLVFNPMQRTIRFFQQEQDLHYGNFYAQWLKCKIFTEKIIKDANSSQPFIKTIGNMLMQSFEKRTSTLMLNKCLLACLYMDPRFHHILSAQQKTEAGQYLKTLWDRINEINPPAAATNSTSNSNPPSTPPPSSSSYQEPKNEFVVADADELLNEYLTQGIEQTNVTNNKIDVYTKIENLRLPFLRSDTNVLAYWKDKEFTDPELYALSNVCFAIPSTQVTKIAYAFSTLNPVLNDYRYHLGEDALDDILLAKLNPNFIDETIENFTLFQNEDLVDNFPPFQDQKDDHEQY